MEVAPAADPKVESDDPKGVSIAPPSSEALSLEKFSSNFAALYQSMFPPQSSVSPPASHPPVPMPPFSVSISSSTSNSPTSVVASPYSSSDSSLLPTGLIFEYKDLADNYLFRIQSLSDEVVRLRAENDDLKLANSELKLANSELLRLAISSHPNSASGPLRPVKTSTNAASNTDDSDEERILLPKSISIRSAGYWKVLHQRQSNNATANILSSPRSRIVPNTDPDPQETQHKVFIPKTRGSVEEKSASNVEVDVYNQGMRKTELCNKWQETGACPYGDHCQFAHGIAELRPVIRHPRYKTQVCRMVLAGDICPYGHRCHFRHSLNDQDKLLTTR